MSTDKHPFLRGCQQALPIALGYFPISITFGVLAVSNGLSPFEATMMSACVYAGASQFIAINLLSQSTALEIILTTFVINLRHLLMSTALGRRMQISTWKASVLSFGITDETFVMATIGDHSKLIRGAYFAGLALSVYVTWVVGTMVGGLFGEIIPSVFTNSMGIALYAMFISLLTPAIKESLRNAFIAASSALLCTALSFFVPELSTGWAVVISTMFSATLGVKLFEGQQEDEQEGQTI